MEDVVIGDCCVLEAALRSGNAELAAETVKKLAEKRSRITLEVVKNAFSLPEKLISLVVSLVQI